GPFRKTDTFSKKGPRHILGYGARNLGYDLARRNLKDAGRAATPAWDIDSILAALSAMIELADGPAMTDLARVFKRRKRGRGRPAGFDCPKLDLLVFVLGFVAARAGVNLTAFTKDGGEVKIPAGRSEEHTSELQSL